MTLRRNAWVSQVVAYTRISLLNNWIQRFVDFTMPIVISSFAIIHCDVAIGVPLDLNIVLSAVVAHHGIGSVIWQMIWISEMAFNDKSFFFGNWRYLFDTKDWNHYESFLFNGCVIFAIFGWCDKLHAVWFGFEILAIWILVWDYLVTLLFWV